MDYQVNETNIEIRESWRRWGINITIGHLEGELGPYTYSTIGISSETARRRLTICRESAVRGQQSLICNDGKGSASAKAIETGGAGSITRNGGTTLPCSSWYSRWHDARHGQLPIRWLIVSVVWNTFLYPTMGFCWRTCCPSLKRVNQPDNGCKQRAVCIYPAVASVPSIPLEKFPGSFGRVISHCGSFVNIRGAHNFPISSPTQTHQVFLQSGERDRIL